MQAPDQRGLLIARESSDQETMSAQRYNNHQSRTVKSSHNVLQLTEHLGQVLCGQMLLASEQYEPET